MRHSIVAAALLACAASAQAKITATAHDAVARPGQPVELRAKFERASWLRWDMKDELVEFTVAGQVTSARTDRDGMARVRVNANVAPGIYDFSARIPRKPRAMLARGRIFVLDPARPIAVVDIDGTLSDLHSWLVPFWGKRAKTFPGAPRVVQALARNHQILYLTARDDVHDRRTRLFLNRHRFPDGPIVFNDRGLTTKQERQQFRGKHHATYKLAELQRLQALGFTLRLGIGDKETDAFAYEGAAIPSYIHTNKQLPAPSVTFISYVQLEQRLIADGVLQTGGGLVASFPSPN
ncbi:MAG: hypothetical protein KDD82_22565 [Planctomycetes bacterium]|nr:hypothetical protein [Planctomycetota bacterium]